MPRTVRAVVLALVAVGLSPAARSVRLQADVDPTAGSLQQAVRLTVTVVLTTADGTALPVPRLALLVSDDPPSRAPQRVVTDATGAAGLNLRPGRYLVETETPVAHEGQAYRWYQSVEVAAGGPAHLELTAANAFVDAVTDAAAAVPIVAGDEIDPAVGLPEDVSPAALRRRWRGSIVSIWTPTRHATGLIVDGRGLIATTRKAIGTATDVEVQFAPDLEVAGHVLPSNAEHDIALVRIDPASLAPLVPATLDCTGPVMPLRDEDEVFTIGAPLRGQPNLVFGTARRINSRLVVADFNLRRISAGGPVLAEDGRLVGLASVDDRSHEFVFPGDAPIASVDHVCAAIRTAEDAMTSEPAPPDVRLPTDSADLISTDDLDAVATARGSELGPYLMASEGFDVAFLTPAMVYGALRLSDPPTMDFSNWTEYVWDAPPVLLVRVTPKQAESFLARLLRGAAMTQGRMLPPITSFKAGFLHLQAFCGDQRVTPIHPFRLELRIAETEAVHEGLYAFAPSAFGPACESARLLLYSEDEPDEADALTIDPAILERIQQDFSAFRSTPFPTAHRDLR